MLRSCCLLVKIQTDVDDKVILDEHCDFLERMLNVILDPKIKNIESEFTIDLRNFKNFDIRNQPEDVPEDAHLDLHGLQATEELLNENTKITNISETLAKFLETSSSLETFLPGLFITDRSQDISGDPHKVSICFTSPQVAINLVRHCPLLTRVSLLGYEDLSDIVLEFISGEHEQSTGLRSLEVLQLPERSYITEQGVRSLLQHLPLLRLLSFPGDHLHSYSSFSR